MKILPYTRIFCDKTVGLLRNLSQHRLQHTVSSDSDKDAPIEMENPYQKERKLCLLCKYNIEPDYKNVRLLSQFQSRFTGRVYGRHITGLCKSKQEKVEKEISKAQHAERLFIYGKFLALNLLIVLIKLILKLKHLNVIVFLGLMGYYTKEIKYVYDPKLFDIDNPFKPHKY